MFLSATEIKEAVPVRQDGWTDEEMCVWMGFYVQNKIEDKIPDGCMPRDVQLLRERLEELESFLEMIEKMVLRGFVNLGDDNNHKLKDLMKCGT